MTQDTNSDLTPLTSDELEAFLSVATHQLRSPLTTMSWSLDLLLRHLETETPQALRHKLEIIKHSTQTLIDLVNDMSTVSHVRRDSLADDLTPQSVPAALQGVVDELQPITERHSVTVTVNVATPELLERRYQIDNKWFAICVKSVILNAIRYSQAYSQVSIKVSEKNGQVCVTVVDHGIGISEADQAHIFEQFFRGQNVHNESEAGSGLGLYITHEIIKRWHGTIQIHSQENQGTTVEICLPLVVAS